MQVAPDYENDKIQEMQAFGWNLQGRQEIHEKGEVEGRPSFVSDSTYVVKTTVYKYVKLHFVRSLELPKLAKIKALEAEYFALSFPSLPGLKAAGCFTFFGVISAVTYASQLGKLKGAGTFVLIMLILTIGTRYPIPCIV
ncbi:MAG: hypothetical protein A2Y78_03320 [Acidobacteria bacterium RBG_13_68_16]|nr:MAG: hypothetical protein A2Y78_03320 [Acidobacteria bacterium RBG_13_68_16]